ncbi:MAG: SDR family oxidoreductase [Haliangiales bacterium]
MKSKMSIDFSDNIAVVTGGTSGIGRATAMAFAASGASVAVAARRTTEGEETAHQITALGGDAIFVQTDVCQAEQVERLVKSTVDHFGGLHLAFNNVGVGGDMKTLEETSVEVWDEVIATNLRSVFLGLKFQAPAIAASGGGAIVNMSSVYGAAGKSAHHAYVASKHGVIGLTRSAALELAPKGIRVNAICPGATSTAAMQMAQEHYPQVVDELVAAHPMQRMATEAEVAAGVLWLCSSDAAFMTGHPLAMDGGYLAA